MKQVLYTLCIQDNLKEIVIYVTNMLSVVIFIPGIIAI